MRLADLPTMTVSGHEGGPDDRARNELVMANQKLVSWAKRRYRVSGVSSEDVAQDAQVGLLHAASRHVPLDGRDFGAYAISFVRAEVRNGIAGTFRSVSMTRSMRVAIEAFDAARVILSSGSDVDPSDDEVMDAMGVVPGEPREMLEAILRADRAHAFPISGGMDDAVEDDRSATSSESEWLREWLHVAMDDLDETSRYVLKHRYAVAAGLSRPVSVKTLAHRLKVDAGRIEQIEREALAMLRESCAANPGRVA